MDLFVDQTRLVLPLLVTMEQITWFYSKFVPILLTPLLFSVEVELFVTNLLVALSQLAIDLYQIVLLLLKKK